MFIVLVYIHMGVFWIQTGSCDAESYWQAIFFLNFSLILSVVAYYTKIDGKGEPFSTGLQKLFWRKWVWV